MKHNFFPLLAFLIGLGLLASCADPNQEKQVRLDFRPHYRVCSHGEMLMNPEDVVDGELDPSLELSECAYLPEAIIAEIQKAKTEEECKPARWSAARSFLPRHKGCKRYEKLRGLSIDSMKHLRTLHCGSDGWWAGFTRKIRGKNKCEIVYKTVRDAGQMMFPGIKEDEESSD